MIQRSDIVISSGGQTGADLAALWAARTCLIQTGGVAPKNFQTLVGRKPELAKFGLTESYGDYVHRTQENVDNNDRTLIIAGNIASPGTKLTINTCFRLNKPYIIIQFNPISPLQAINEENVRRIADFITACPFRPITLNVAGNSTRSSEHTYEVTFKLLHQALTMVVEGVGTLSIEDLNKAVSATKDRYGD